MAKELKPEVPSHRYADLIERWGVERRVVKSAAEKGKIQRLPSKGAVLFSEGSVLAFERELGWQPGQKFPFPVSEVRVYVKDSLGNTFRIHRDEATGTIVAEPPFTPEAAAEFDALQKYGTFKLYSRFAIHEQDEELADFLEMLAKEARQELRQLVMKRRSAAAACPEPRGG